jgi:hypothetical protein
MQFTLIGGRTLRLPSGWTSESTFTVLGEADVDATAEPGPDAVIRTFAVIGATKVRVPAGARVKLKGGNLLGGRTVEVTPGEGPELTVLACSLLGGVRISDG